MTDAGEIGTRHAPRRPTLVDRDRPCCCGALAVRQYGDHIECPRCGRVNDA